MPTVITAAVIKEVRRQSRTEDHVRVTAATIVQVITAAITTATIALAIAIDKTMVHDLEIMEITTVINLAITPSQATIISPAMEEDTTTITVPAIMAVTALLVRE